MSIETDILQLSNDGDDLAPEHLKLIEISANHGLNKRGEQELQDIYNNLKEGKYKAPWFMGVSGMTQDHEGYIYYHGKHVEHYTNSAFENAEAIKKDLIELKNRCELLIKNNVEVTAGNTVWLWGNHDFQKERA